MGCPVIISDACGSYGPTDDVQPGRNGFVYPMGNITLLAKGVEFLYHSIEMRVNYSEASKRIGQHNQRLAHGESLLAAATLLEHATD